jgi:DNA-binding SARP family transcriptional activator
MKPALTTPNVRILGPIEAWHDNQRLDLGGPRQIGLFAFLLLHANRAVPSDTLTDALWGPVRTGADNRLHMAVARLRKSLAPLEPTARIVVRTVRSGYMLSLGPNQLDAEMFAELVQQGLRAIHEDELVLATRVLTAAVALWRGPPLAEVAYEDFAQGEISRLRELRRVALETRIEAELRLGRHRELIGELGRLLAEHPTCERITAQLMLALYRSERQADALEVYDRTRLQLSTQLGLEPGPTLKTLQTNILAHTPSLRQSNNTRPEPPPTAPTRSPLKEPPGPLPALHPSRMPHPVWAPEHPGATSMTRAHSYSTPTHLTTGIRWRGSSKPWSCESWTAPRTQHTGGTDQRLNRAA